MNTPTIEQVKALDGKIFAMLTAEEQSVLDFYRSKGRKYGVAVTIINEADPDELARARSQDQADQIMKRANSRVSVTVAVSRKIMDVIPHTATPWVWNNRDQLVSAVATDDDGTGDCEPSLIIETDSGYYPPNNDDRKFIAFSCSAIKGLIAALEQIRDSSITANMSDHLSDTEMARIAGEALKAADDVLHAVEATEGKSS